MYFYRLYFGILSEECWKYTLYNSHYLCKNLFKSCWLGHRYWRTKLDYPMNLQEKTFNIEIIIWNRENFIHLTYEWIFECEIVRELVKLSLSGTTKFLRKYSWWNDDTLSNMLDWNMKILILLVTLYTHNFENVHPIFCLG